MTSIATLRATNCSRLLYVAEQIVAACGTKTAYVFQYTGDQVKEASCTAPREADIFAPWLPPGAPITATRALYTIRKDGGSAVLVQSAEGGAAAPLEIIPSLPEKVEELRIFYQSILTLQTASEVRFYFLDPSTSAATLMGTCALPAWSDSRDVRIDVTSSECWAAAPEKTVCVLCLSPERIFVALVVCASNQSAVVVRHTAAAGVPLPPSSSSSSPSPIKVMGWTVRWARQELLLLLGSAGPERQAVELAAFSLQVSGSSTSHPQLERWATNASLASSLAAASGEALRTASDVCSDGEGSHVWLCDTATGPSVILREVTTADQTQVVLAGTNASARLTVARGVPGMFVLAGRSLFVVRGEKGTSSTSSTSASANVQKAGVVSQEAAGSTMSDWLQKRAEPSTEQPAPQQPAVAVVDVAQPRPAARQPVASKATSAVFVSGGSTMKERLLQYVLGASPSVAGVVRDAVYVRETVGAAPRHEILAAIADKFGDDAEQCALASLRYAAVAQSLHPYTVLALLNVGGGEGVTEAASAGLLLAMATLLAEKSTLQHGGLQRLPHFAAVSAAFFATPGGAFTTELAKKQYTADICAGAMAALANGGLGATRLLFAVADRAVSVIYGGRADAHVTGAAEEACEATIAEAISLMRSFVEWSLTASSSLGVMSAHIGTPQTLTKEAALRDGKSHPIDTSRQVEIRPLQVTRLPKRTL